MVRLLSQPGVTRNVSPIAMGLGIGMNRPTVRVRTPHEPTSIERPSFAPEVQVSVPAVHQVESPSRGSPRSPMVNTRLSPATVATAPVFVHDGSDSGTLQRQSPRLA